MQFQTLAATQKGSQLADRIYTVGQTTSQPQDRQVRDLDFETGRFFWVVDPTALPGYPALDILNLAASSPPGQLRPTQVRVYRFRPAAIQTARTRTSAGSAPSPGSSDRRHQPVLRAGALGAPDPGDRLLPGSVWAFGSRSATKLDQHDYLAVSYVTADGKTVGSFPAAGQPGRRRQPPAYRPAQDRT